MPHGSQITWRFKDSEDMVILTHASYEEQAASPANSTVDCDPEVTATQAFEVVQAVLKQIL